MPTDSNLVARKLRCAAGQLRYLPRTIRLVWDASGRWTSAWLVLLIFQGLLPAATVYLTRGLVDGLVAATGSQQGWVGARSAIIYACLMAAALLLGELLRNVASFVRTAQADLVQDHISALLHEKSTTVDVSFYEMPEYYDHLHQARGDANYRPLVLLESLGGMLQNGITLVAMSAVLVPYGWWLPVALIASTLPAFLVVLRFAVRRHEFWQRTTSDQRKSEYYDWLLTTGEPAAEIRLFGLGDHFRSIYQELRSRLRSERMGLALSEGAAGLIAALLALIVTGGAMAWMLWRAIHGHVTLGGIALFYQAFTQGQTLMRSLLEDVGQIYANTLFLGHLFEFLDLQPVIQDPELPGPVPALRDAIRFREVTFRYPGSHRTALERFNLEIPKGRIVAIVGANGAGKSTLIKLLCRLYDPVEGSVQIDGADLRSFKVEELRRMVTVLFQQPVHYSATVAENIALGDVHPNLVDVIDAAREAGAEEIIQRLPNQYNNMLGKWFSGGAELSGGEWQRIALARAFHRQAPILLLDEPTSAMDSWAEEEWLRSFRTLARGRTVVIITHRFTTAMRADIIHVMDEGQIVESGTHEELLEQRGRYASSWLSQVQSERVLA